jgi:hypothetical protein
MVSSLFYSHLALLAILWLFVMLHLIPFPINTYESCLKAYRRVHGYNCMVAQLFFRFGIIPCPSCRHDTSLPECSQRIRRAACLEAHPLAPMGSAPPRRAGAYSPMLRPFHARRITLLGCAHCRGRG